MAAKIDYQTAKTIRMLRGDGVPYARISIDLGVSVATITRVMNGTLWRNPPEEEREDRFQSISEYGREATAAYNSLSEEEKNTPVILTENSSEMDRTKWMHQMSAQAQKEMGLKK